MTFTRSTPPENRDETGRFLAGQSGNHGGRPEGFHSYIQERTADGSELTDFVISVFRDDNASNKERMDADYMACRPRLREADSECSCTGSGHRRLHHRHW